MNSSAKRIHKPLGRQFYFIFTQAQAHKKVVCFVVVDITHTRSRMILTMCFFLGIPKKKKNETKTLSNPFKQQRRHCVYEG